MGGDFYFLVFFFFFFFFGGGEAWFFNVRTDKIKSQFYITLLLDNMLSVYRKNMPKAGPCTPLHEMNDTIFRMIEQQLIIVTSCSP